MEVEAILQAQLVFNGISVLGKKKPLGFKSKGFYG
jgi:hypothetical protein